MAKSSATSIYESWWLTIVLAKNAWIISSRKAAKTQIVLNNEEDQRKVRKMLILMPGEILIGIIFIILASPFLNNFFGSPDLGMVFVVWITLLLGSVVVCHIIGSVVWRLIAAKVLRFSSEQNSAQISATPSQGIQYL